MILKNYGSWTKLVVVAIAGLVLVNLYVSALENRVMPLKAGIDLSHRAGKQTFVAESFYFAKYTLLIAFSESSDPSSPLPRKWTELNDRIRGDFDVEVEITLTDSSGNLVISHTGGLDDWTVTNAAYSKDDAGALYRYSFDARMFESYTLEVSVLEPSDTANRLNPTIIFHGIDDGYLMFVRPFLNGIWVSLIVIFAVLILLTRLTTRLMRRTQSR